MRTDRLTLLACVTLLAACADSPAGPLPAPSAMSIVAGDQQVQPAGTALRTAPTVRVTDADGHPLPGIAVTFAAGRTSAVDPVVAYTGQDGLASTQWSLRSDGGEDTLLAKVDSLSPVVFHATSLVFTDISAGYQGTCGVATGGRAYCWGANQFGQLGKGDTLDALQPAPVAGAETFSQYVLGTTMSCGLATDGRVLCAGLSRRFNPTLYGPSPTVEGGALRFSKLVTSAGDIACGLEQSATAYCWGNITAFLTPADSIPGARATFRVVPGGAAADLSLETGVSPYPEPYQKVCVLRSPGSIACYDAWLEFTRAYPPVSAGPTIEVSAAPLEVCWIDRALAVWCEDQSSNRPTASIALPVAPWDIEAADSRTCTATDLGVYCWETILNGAGPALVPHTAGMQFRKLSMATDHICALDAQSRAWCWGANEHGQLGDGTADSSAVPRQVQIPF